MYERSLEEEALLQELEDQKACPTCKRRVQDDYLICPSCRTQLKESCRSCSRPLSYAWLACPYCGLEKPPREGFGPRPARQLPRTEAAPARVPQQATTRPEPATASTQSQPAPVARTQQDPLPAPRTITRPAPLHARDPFARSNGPANDGGPVIGE
jgi:RNA polymerase subunit RPABC4/transcription elongation factor Spt4